MSKWKTSRSIRTEHVSLRNVILGTVRTRKATINSSLAGAVAAQDNATLTAGAALALVSGGDMVVTAGGGAILAAGGDAHIQGGGAGMVIARQANVERSMVGVVLSGKTNLGEGARVIMGTLQAMILGAGLGVSLPLAHFMLKRLVAPHWPVPKRPREGSGASPATSAPFSSKLARWVLMRAATIAVAVAAFLLVRSWLRRKMAGLRRSITVPRLLPVRRKAA